jgi:DNA-binding transcriptional LysR family regulator
MTPVPDYSLRQLSYLVAVSDAGSMTAAAERCYVTQAAISAAIRDLERIFGVALVARQPGRGASLTEAGAGVVADSRRLLRFAGDLYEEVQAPPGSLRGRVALGCFPALTPRYVPLLFQLLQQEHPGIQLEVIEGSQDELNAAALSGACDVLLTYETGLAHDLQRRIVDTAEPYLLLPADHRLGTRDSLELRALADEPLILYSLAPCPGNAEALLRTAGVTPRIVHVCSSIETVRSMVARGLGWTTLVQQWPANVSLEGLPLLQRRITPAAPSYGIVMAWTRGSRKSRRHSILLDLVHECYRSQ